MNSVERLEKPEIKAIEVTKPAELDRERLVSWLFLLGSLLFTLDAVLENLRGISFSSLLHISASILFTVGSLLFMPKPSQDWD